MKRQTLHKLYTNFTQNDKTLHKTLHKLYTKLNTKKYLKPTHGSCNKMNTL